MNSRINEEQVAKKTKILIVEDEASARTAYGLYLRRCGFETCVAANAEEAIQAVSRIVPDVVLSDWKLGPGKDGVEVVRELQQQFPVNVIFASAYPMDELRQATADLEVSAYFRKPVSLPDLAAVIRKL